MGLYFDRVGRNDCTLGDAVEYLKSKQIAGESDRKIKVKRREELSAMYNGKKRYE